MAPIYICVEEASTSSQNLVSGRIEIDLHEDKGKGPHHQIITKKQENCKT